MENKPEIKEGFNMSKEIPELVRLDLYRNALDSLEHISRKNGNRKIHAWAVKMKKGIGELMMQVAADEMYGEVEETEEDKKKKADAEFYGNPIA